MKAYKVELLILDFDNISEEDMKYYLENVKYLNPHVMSMKSREIGEWDDSHPLNHRDTQQKTFDDLFKE